MSTPPAPSRRVGFRLDWCAYVMLVCDAHPELTQAEAFRFVDEFLPSPFPNIGAYYDFVTRKCVQVRTRKREIWQEWTDREKKSGSYRGPELVEGDATDLEKLVGVRITDTVEGLGMTGLRGRPRKR